MKPFTFLLALAASVVSLLPATAAPTQLDYPIHFVSEDGQLHEAGVFFNRGGSGNFSQRIAPQGEDEQQERTTPYDPNTAPKFEAAPGTAPDLGAAISDAVKDPAKVDWSTLLSQLLPVIIAALAGGAAGGSIPWSSIIQTILGSLVKAPEPTKAKVRKAVRRVSKAAAKSKPTPPPSS